MLLTWSSDRDGLQWNFVEVSSNKPKLISAFNKINKKYIFFSGKLDFMVFLQFPLLCI